MSKKIDVLSLKGEQVEAPVLIHVLTKKGKGYKIRR